MGGQHSRLDALWEERVEDALSVVSLFLGVWWVITALQP